MPLPDSRVYATGLVKNSVITQLNAVLAETEPGGKRAQQQALAFLLTQYLEQGNQDAIAVALSLVPSQHAYQHLWQTLATVLLPSDTPQQAQIFALPVILVAGSHHPLTLPAELTLYDRLVTHLKAQHVLDSQADITLSRHLYSADALASITLPQLYDWHHTLQHPSTGLPIDLVAEPISVVGQQVFLRYLLGIALRNVDCPTPVSFTPTNGTWGLEAAAIIQQSLHQTGLTLFAIPRQPQPLLDALTQGQSVYLDISMQVFVSDTVRKYRQRQQTPTACIACYDNHQIKLILTTREVPEKWQGFIWPLRALDVVADIEQQIRQLLYDCHVTDITVLPDIQPTAGDAGTPPFMATSNAATDH